MFKLNKVSESMENMIEKIERKIEELEEAKTLIEDAAFYRDKELTKREWDKLYKIEEEIDSLRCEIDDIENAIECLKDYTD